MFRGGGGGLTGVGGAAAGGVSTLATGRASTSCTGIGGGSGGATFGESRCAETSTKISNAWPATLTDAVSSPRRLPDRRLG